MASFRPPPLHHGSSSSSQRPTVTVMQILTRPLPMQTRTVTSFALGLPSTMFPSTVDPFGPATNLTSWALLPFCTASTTAFEKVGSVSRRLTNVRTPLSNNSFTLVSPDSLTAEATAGSTLRSASAASTEFEVSAAIAAIKMTNMVFIFYCVFGFLSPEWVTKFSACRRGECQSAAARQSWCRHWLHSMHRG